MAKEHPGDQLADIDGGPLANTQQSIFAHIERGLIKNPHQPAVICMHQQANDLADWVEVDEEYRPDRNRSGPETTCLTLTYTQLHRGALKLVAGLVANGVRPGSSVLCMIPNGGEYALLLWACAILRLTLSAVDPSVMRKEKGMELQNYMKSLKPGLVVVPDANGARAVDTAAAAEQLDVSSPSLQLLILNDDGEASPPSSGWKYLRDVLKPGKSLSNGLTFDESTLLSAARRDDPDRIHSILFTSGTSGSQPKGCPLRVGSMTHILESQSWLITGPTSARVLQQAHNSRAIGPQHTLQTWRAGGAVVLATGPSFAVEHTLEAMRRHAVTFVVLSPAMVHALAREPAARRDAVRAVQVGGDAVAREVLVRCAALFPRARVCVNHGMSEGGGFFVWPFFDRPVGDVPYFGEICPAGEVAPGARVRVWDAAAGRTALRGQPGELHVCCESLICGYLDGVDASAFYEDGRGVRWMNTGDVAMVSEEGLVYILGRSKDAITRGSIVIIPAALESCVEKYTGAQVSLVVRNMSICRPASLLVLFSAFPD